MSTGVTVSHQGRIFVSFPRWGDEVPFTVSEIRDGEAVAFPDKAMNQTDPNDQTAALVSVQSVVVDPSDRLWMLDTGSPLFQPTKYGGPKLVCVDLTIDKVVKKILFPQDVALSTTYLNDVRFNKTRQRRHGVYYRFCAKRTKWNHCRGLSFRYELASTPRPSIDEVREVANLSPDCGRVTIPGG